MVQVGAHAHCVRRVCELPHVVSIAIVRSTPSSDSSISASAPASRPAVVALSGFLRISSRSAFQSSRKPAEIAAHVGHGRVDFVSDPGGQLSPRPPSSAPAASAARARCARSRLPRAGAHPRSHHSPRAEAPPRSRGAALPAPPGGPRKLTSPDWVPPVSRARRTSGGSCLLVPLELEQISERRLDGRRPAPRTSATSAGSRSSPAPLRRRR